MTLEGSRLIAWGFNPRSFDIKACALKGRGDSVIPVPLQQPVRAYNWDVFNPEVKTPG